MRRLLTWGDRAQRALFAHYGAVFRVQRAPGCGCWGGGGLNKRCGNSVLSFTVVTSINRPFLRWWLAWQPIPSHARVCQTSAGPTAV